MAATIVIKSSGDDPRTCRTGAPVRLRWMAVAAIIVSVLIPLLLAAQPVRYDIRTISGIAPVRINDRRQVAGNIGPLVARWENGSAFTYPGLSPAGSRALAINGVGEIAGWSVDGNNDRHAVVFRNDTSFLILAGPGRGIGGANGINDFGDVAGYFDFCDTCRPSNRRNHAVLWRGGTIADLGTIEDAESEAIAVNNYGMVVGVASEGTSFDSRAFMTAGGGLTPLGNLGAGQSRPYDVNDNGMVVGISEETNDVSRAVIWNPGIQNIQTLPGSWSRAWAVNDDGQVVGDIATPAGSRGFIWQQGTMTLLDSLVPPDSGWVIEHAVDINGPGDILALARKNSVSTYVILIPGLTITRPGPNERWMAGETDTIRWQGGLQGHALELRFSADSGRTFDLIGHVPYADSGRFVWQVPGHVISKHCFIRAEDLNDPSLRDTSGRFRIKPYILTRDSGGQYEPYRPEEDVWSFPNQAQYMFPPAWYQQFDYRGTDPFTGQSYVVFAPYQLALSSSSSFPDWISWVRAFGADACYHRIAFPPVYSYAAVYRWYAMARSWQGSCFGLAASNALVFSYREQFRSRYAGFPAFADPVSVPPDTSVRRVVSGLFTHQFGDPSREHTLSLLGYVTPNETLRDLKAMLREDEGSPRTLSFMNNNGMGGHNVLPYRVRQDNTAQNIYYIFVYDNNFPLTTTIIRIDTADNAQHGVWMPLYGNAGWGGPRKFLLMTESRDYLQHAVFAKPTAERRSPFILSPDRLEVITSPGVDLRIEDAHGNVTGHRSGAAWEDITGSVPLVSFDGSETPPYGYALPAGSYRVTMDSCASDTVMAFFFTGSRTYLYSRGDSRPDHTDRLRFHDGVSVSNPDTQQRTIGLLALVNETTREKMVSFSGMDLPQGDSVAVATVGENDLRLISHGASREYDLELTRVDGEGTARFMHARVPLQANTTHLLEPGWEDLAGTALRILVDHGNTGTVDDTLYLANQAGGTVDTQEEIHPGSYRLDQNFPNPFNPGTTISFEVPHDAVVTLRVFNMLGQEVLTLIDGMVAAGQHRVHLDARSLSSGVYYYRLEGAGYTGVKRMLLLR